VDPVHIARVIGGLAPQALKLLALGAREHLDRFGDGAGLRFAMELSWRIFAPLGLSPEAGEDPSG